MLGHLELEGVGPAKHMRLDFAPRINVLTGDNGVGKTFLLDIAWWALTGTWPDGRTAMPITGDAAKAIIEFTLDEAFKPRLPEGGLGDVLRFHQHVRSHYIAHRQHWESKVSGSGVQATGDSAVAFAVYARANGSFAVWDPVRNVRDHWTTHTWRKNESSPPPTYELLPREVLHGLRDDDSNLCAGLIHDWVLWQEGSRKEFRQLTQVLRALSGPDEPMEPGKPRRVLLTQSIDQPTVKLPYGTVPVTQLSAAMQRIASLAYLLIWAWQEHQKMSELAELPQFDRMVLLIDEVECHLHPRWQRVILPAVLAAMKELCPEVQVQLLCTTHAPLVLASLETEYDEEQDRVFNLELHDADVTVHAVDWAKQGDASNWLVSDAFDLKRPRSRDSERAIEAAYDFMAGYRDRLPEELSTRASIQRELERVLPDQDPFWAQWVGSNADPGE